MKECRVNMICCQSWPGCAFSKDVRVAAALATGSTPQGSVQALPVAGWQPDLFRIN